MTAGPGVPKRRIKVMNTAFRDGFQSVFGGRVFTKDFLPAVEAAREAGITHFEAGGGARFQSLYFFCNEDAFEMMDAFREAAGPDANLQTLARGVNVVGLDSQSSDIIQLHARSSSRSTASPRSATSTPSTTSEPDLQRPVHRGGGAPARGGGHDDGAPAGLPGSHTADFYESVLKEILDADIPYDSVCFKDASGTSVPVQGLRDDSARPALLPRGRPPLPHPRDRRASRGRLQGRDRGGRGRDRPFHGPCSGGTSQPDIAMWHALRGTEYELDLDIDKVMEAEKVFKDCMKDYYMPPEASGGRTR
jgi:pyruvate carboxylase subunit B